MPSGVFLGFDFGMKRIGCAVGQAMINSARPLSTLKAQHGSPDWQQVKNLITEWRPQALLVGYPTNIDGSEQFTSVAAKKFANRLHGRFGLPVHLVDERLTTVEARQCLFDEGGYRKITDSEVDSYAAKLIVEQWFSEQGTEV